MEGLVNFSGANITIESKLEFEELLGKGETKSSQPKRAAEEGEIEDEPIKQDYPNKTRRMATRMDIKRKIEEQREISRGLAKNLLLSDDYHYTRIVMEYFLDRSKEAGVYQQRCVACEEDWATWDESFRICRECEESFLLHCDEK